MALTLLLLLFSPSVKLLCMGPWSELFCMRQAILVFFMMFLIHFFELQLWEVSENFKYFFADKMVVNKNSDNAKSISIAEWQEIFGNIDNDRVWWAHLEPQQSSEDESSESQMHKDINIKMYIIKQMVMMTEVEELGYWDEDTEISGDRKNMSLLPLYN